MKKKLFWIAGAAVVLVAAAAVAVLLLGRDKGPVLYRNLDGHRYTLNTEVRQRAEDGLYHLRFARDGQVVELTVAEEETVLLLDSMDVWGLKTDKQGAITEVMEAATFVTELCDDYFVQKTENSSIFVNSSLAMNGAAATVTAGKETKLYDVCDGNVTEVTVQDLKPLDAVSAYGDERGNVTHIYVISHPTESDVYWRTARKYSSSKKETTREPDENGVYALDFYSNGETVTLQCKDKSLVTTIDMAGSDSPHFGFTFDEEGFIIGTVKSAFGLRGLLACEAHDVTAVNGNGVNTLNKLSGKGEIWDGTVAENCRIYDISDTAYAEGRRGQAVEALQVGDRVTVFTDTENRAICVFITNRLVDVPAYFSVSRKYDSTKKETSRKPDADGFYTVSLVKDGDTEAVTYKTRDKDLMTYLDSTSSRCVGIVADESNILQTVYLPHCLFGQTAWSNGGVVSSVAGSVVTRMTYGKPTSVANGVMMPDCKIYNMSTTGEYGAPTTLQKGDYIYAFRQPEGELVRIYVARRHVGADTMYYHFDRRYDEQKKETTREVDDDGWYHFTLYYQGKTVQLKTGEKALADKLDSYSAVSLKVTADIIEEVNAPNYACGGSEVAKGNRYAGRNAKGSHVAVDAKEKETAFTMGDTCVIYDTTKGGKPVETLTEGDIITVYTDRNGTAQIIFIQE